MTPKEMVTRSVEAFNRGDVAALAALYAADAVSRTHPATPQRRRRPRPGPRPADDGPAVAGHVRQVRPRTHKTKVSGTRAARG